MPRFPQAIPTLCPTRPKGYPQVIHQHVGVECRFGPNILCSGLDKPQRRSYILGRYIEALGHKWRACSGASCIPKTIKPNNPANVLAKRFENTLAGDDLRRRS